MRRILLVSNRLPYTISKSANGYQFKSSDGGLANALKSLTQSNKMESLWVGWPGEIPEKANITFPDNTVPVILDKEQIENFYEGFCNKVIWPLFHYFPQYCEYNPEYWESYLEVNELFAETIIKSLKKDDQLFIHDYHLMLLPKLLRDKGVKNKIGFFLHIPFPAFEVFKFMPTEWRKKILQGLLGSDLVGFHTDEYTQNFLASCQFLLNQNVEAQVGTFPIQIDFNKFFKGSQTKKVLAKKDELKGLFGNKKLILSLDRLDYSKGINHRLKGFEQFLKDNPQFQKKVSLVMVCIPSRTNIPQYEAMKNQVEEAVGRINGKYGSLDWTPIIYQYRSLTPEELLALYSLANVALVTPLKDGMNLVAKEFVASKDDQTGVLILSEMTGSAVELKESLIINPNSPQEISTALKDALEMPLVLQRQRNRVMQEYLKEHDVNFWLNSFLEELSQKVDQEEFVLDTELPTVWAADFPRYQIYAHDISIEEKN